MDTFTKSMVKTLKILVGLSISASILTLASTRFGLGELYPFSSWKLFTQPAGSLDLTVQKNIYGQTPKGGWQLLPLKSSPNYDYDDAYYLFNELCSRIEKDTIHKTQLRQFAKTMYPSFNAFQLRAKSFKVSSIVADSSMYTEKVICEF